MSALQTPRTDLATYVGRSAALCVHPYAAWRRHRTLLAFAYFAAGFVVVFTGLLVRSVRL